MKVELIKQVFVVDGYNESSYKYKPFKWCCQDASTNPLIELVCEYLDNTNDYDEYNSLKPSITLRHSYTTYDWEDEYQEDVYYKINYCPFCGEPIEFILVGEEDVSEIVSKLKTKRDEVWKKYTKTDSKKKSEELRKVVYELDSKINYFYELSEYDDNMRELVI